MEIIPAEEVCEYTYKVELIEINKISIVVFNTTTGIKYQRYIEEYSEAWEDIKTKFQNNFSLCFKMFTKALIDNNPTFTVSILHKIDYVVLQLSYINDLLGFTIDINIDQYNKDNLQESVNILDYKQKQLETENKELKEEIQSIYRELDELKRIINLLGDSLSYDNILSSSGHNPVNKGDLFTRKDRDKMCKLNFSQGGNQYGTMPNLAEPIGIESSGAPIHHPFLTVDVINKLGYKIFNNLINKYELDYDINKLGYDWTILSNMLKLRGGEAQSQITHCINYAINKDQINTNIYDLTWKSFKELFSIKI